MQRQYKPERRSKTFKKYDRNIIQQVVEEYSAGGNSLDSIAKKYQTQQSVLYRHSNRKMKVEDVKQFFQRIQMKNL